MSKFEQPYKYGHNAVRICGSLRENFVVVDVFELRWRTPERYVTIYKQPKNTQFLRAKTTGFVEVFYVKSGYRSNLNEKVETGVKLKFTA